MAYEYEEYIKNVIGTEAVFSHEKEKRQERVQELQEVYHKAKAFDEIKKLIIEKLKEEEEKPRILLDDYDYGLYQAYDKIDDVIQDFEECADDGR
ncbi:hypothetical protein [Staphylococcus arlettae]|uniref:hypothetical protein n=1 Tax=Staphylococcus arlettae TaxID=29378 RepID=UPI002DBA1C36|nr:hypothetical protein [Staphylococcus arlettae]MEB5899821.1 hypothetical protein [Staphylococcus arlettae]